MLSKQRLKASVAVTALLQLILLLLLPSEVMAETRPTFCNRGDHRLNVANVHDYWVQGTRYWSENGWWTIEAHSCETMPVIPEFRVFGYAFMARRGDEFLYPTFNPNTANTQGDVTSGKMCADPINEFHYATKSPEEIGIRCSANGFTLPLSFFYSTERVTIGQEPIENLTIDLEWDYNSMNGSRLSKPAQAEKVSLAEAKQAAKSYRHKFFLVAYLDTVYRKKNVLDSNDIFFGSAELAGHTEIDAFHGLLTQNLEYLEQTYIGTDLRFDDKYQLRQAMLPGYEIDRGLKPIKLSKMGRQIFEELAEHMGIANQVRDIERYFISTVTKPEDHDQEPVITLKPDGKRRMLSREQTDNYLNERAIAVAEAARIEKQEAAKKAREEKRRVRKEAFERERAERKRLADITRAELAAEIKASAIARAENTRKYNERQARAMEQNRKRIEEAKKRKLARDKEALLNVQKMKEQTSSTTEYVDNGKIKKRRLLVPDPEEYKEQLANRLNRLEKSREKKQVVNSDAESSLLAEVLLAPFPQNQIFHGAASSGSGEQWPLDLEITSYTSSNGKWAGTITWKNLNAVHKVEGTISTKDMSFVETAYIKKGQALLGCKYSFKISPDGGMLSGRVTGEWKCGQSGDVWIEF